MSKAVSRHFRWRWALLGLYTLYCLGVLVWWLSAWNPNAGMLRWLGWWNHFAHWMILPTLPASLTLGAVLRLEPQWFGVWLAHHDYICLILTWGWLALAGYVQWFILLPRLFTRLRGFLENPKNPNHTAR